MPSDLEAIIETPAEPSVEIPLECIRPFEGQPRTYFDKDALYRLSQSIKTRGQKQPIQVRRIEEVDGIDYEIVDGERRWRACQIAKIPSIKAIVITVKDIEDQFEISAISNFGKADHTPLEIANAIRRIREQKKLTIDEIACGFSMSSASIYNYISLLNLDDRVQAFLNPSLPEDKKLKLAIALSISKINSKESQFHHACFIINNKLSVVQARSYLQKVTSRDELRPSKSSNKPRDDFRSLMRTVHNIISYTDYARNLRQGNYDEIFWNKSVFDVQDIASNLDTAIKQLHAMRTSIQEVLDRKKLKVKVS